ncbi:uncharacterized protein LOC105435861 isoform X1 [Cucumis sativus]|nr:uncharacterized protein LOC105435861 isoform X1 [Cucumis sativus]
MAFLRFACFLLVVLPVTSLSIIKFHQQEDKDVAEDRVGSLKMELLRNNNIGGRRLGAAKEFMEMENSKSFGKNGSKEKISNMVFSSASNEENGKKKNKKKEVSSLETKKMGISGSTVVYNNADYLTYMHHPPKHN